MARAITARIDKLEKSRGGDETERWLRSLTDEQLEAEIARCDAKCREVLSAHGVDPSGMSTDALVPTLQALKDAAGAVEMKRDQSRCAR